MMTMRFYVSLILFCVSLSGSLEARAVRRQVSELHNQNVLGQLVNNDATVLVFYSPRCGHCHRFRQDLGSISASLPAVNFVLVSAPQFRPLAQQYNVQVYPTFIYFSDGSRVGESFGYDGSHAFVNTARAKLHL